MSQPKKSTVLSKKLSPPFDITQECDNSGSFPMFLDTPGKSTKAESQASAQPRVLEIHSLVPAPALSLTSSVTQKII